MKKRIKKKLIKKGIIKICGTCIKIAECHIGFDGDYYCSQECEILALTSPSIPF